MFHLAKERVTSPSVRESLADVTHSQTSQHMTCVADPWDPGWEVLPLRVGCHGPTDFWEFNHLDLWEQVRPSSNLPQCWDKQ